VTVAGGCLPGAGDGKVTSMAITSGPGTVRRGRSRRGTLRIAFAVIWVSVYFIGGIIAAATGNVGGAEIGLSVGTFFALLLLLTWRRSSRS
jgi:uncharacterized membrane protein